MIPKSEGSVHMILKSEGSVTKERRNMILKSEGVKEVFI